MQIVIDSCCATFAEYQKRGKDFWAEFELYLADLLVGVVVDIALVGMLAPYARIGKQSVMSRGFFGRLHHACDSLPSRFSRLRLIHKIISGYPDLTPTKNKNKTDLFTEAYRNHWVPLIESDKFHNIHYM